MVLPQQLRKRKVQSLKPTFTVGLALHRSSWGLSTHAVPLSSVQVATPGRATMFWCGVFSDYNSETRQSSFVSTLNIMSY